MTKPLDDAISELRTLSDADQNWAADNIRALMRERERALELTLTPEQIEEIEQTIADLEAGRTRLLTEEETEAMWRRVGL